MGSEAKPIHSSLDNFLDELQQIGKKIQASIGPRDFKHLKKIERFGRFFTFLGYSTAWIIPNPFSAFFISWGIVTRWCIMHHIGHGGYDRIPNIPVRYTSKGFAQGWRRYLDWIDWMLPEAWKYEHNVLHHYNTGELADPDLVEINLAFLRDSKVWMPVRYLFVILTALTWKFTYYVPNTMSHYAKFKKETRSSLFMNWTFCYLPYAFIRFALIPLAFFPLGNRAMLYILINSIFAELITNFHSYLIVGPNHTGDDVMRFSTVAKNKVEYYLRQITGSVNYACGSDTVDLLQLWLNYQIEHHIWPDIPMLKYQEYQPQVKALCNKYKVPYIQENVFLRFKKLTDIMIGKTSMVEVRSVS